MNDEQFNAAVRVLSASLTEAIKRRGVDQAESAKVLLATLGQSLANQIGPVATVERLRDLADIMEAQALRDMVARH